MKAINYLFLAIFVFFLNSCGFNPQEKNIFSPQEVVDCDWLPILLGNDESLTEAHPQMEFNFTAGNVKYIQLTVELDSTGREETAYMTWNGQRIQFLMDRDVLETLPDMESGTGQWIGRGEERFVFEIEVLTQVTGPGQLALHWGGGGSYRVADISVCVKEE